MAITINYNPSIAAGGAVASQYGGYLANQQNFQNNLQLSKLMQQDRQFYDSMKFRQNSMLFQDRSRQRESLQQRDAARQSQMLNIASQRQQNAFNAQQRNVQFEQQVYRDQLRDNRANDARDAGFKQQRKMLEFQDELTKERFTYEYDEQQKRKMEEYRKSIAQIRSFDGYDDEEKNMAEERLMAKMMGIEPLPREKPVPIVPDNQQPGMTYTQTNADGSVSTYFMKHDYTPQHLNTSRPPSKQFVAEDGSVQIKLPDGKPMTVVESEFDSRNRAQSEEAFMKYYLDADNFDQDWYESDDGKKLVAVGEPNADGTQRTRPANVQPSAQELEVLRDEFLYGKRLRVEQDVEKDTGKYRDADGETIVVDGTGGAGIGQKAAGVGLGAVRVKPKTAPPLPSYWMDSDSPGGYRRDPGSHAASFYGRRDALRKLRQQELGADQAAEMDATEEETRESPPSQSPPSQSPPSQSPPSSSPVPPPTPLNMKVDGNTMTAETQKDGQGNLIDVTSVKIGKDKGISSTGKMTKVTNPDTKEVSTVLEISNSDGTRRNLGLIETDNGKLDIIFDKKGKRLELGGKEGRSEGIRFARKFNIPIVNQRHPGKFADVHTQESIERLMEAQNQFLSNAIKPGDTYYSQTLDRFFVKGLEEITDPKLVNHITVNGITYTVLNPDIYSAKASAPSGRETGKTLANLKAE